MLPGLAALLWPTCHGLGQLEPMVEQSAACLETPYSLLQFIVCIKPLCLERMFGVVLIFLNLLRFVVTPVLTLDQGDSSTVQQLPAWGPKSDP